MNLASIILLLIAILIISISINIFSLKSIKERDSSIKLLKKVILKDYEDSLKKNDNKIQESNKLLKLCK